MIGHEKSAILTVADDHERNEFLASALKATGHQVVSTTCGIEAAEPAKRERPDFFLLDAEMPGIGGLEVCPRIKALAETEGVPILFLSGKGEVADKVKGPETGAIDHTPKPFSVSELLATVKTHLASKQLWDEMPQRSFRPGVNLGGKEVKGKGLLEVYHLDSRHERIRGEASREKTPKLSSRSGFGERKNR